MKELCGECVFDQGDRRAQLIENLQNRALDRIILIEKRKKNNKFSIYRLVEEDQRTTFFASSPFINPRHGLHEKIIHQINPMNGVLNFNFRFSKGKFEWREES